jgi:hypothetical protein
VEKEANEVKVTEDMVQRAMRKLHSFSSPYGILHEPSMMREVLEAALSRDNGTA